MINEAVRGGDPLIGQFSLAQEVGATLFVLELVLPTGDLQEVRNQ